MSSFQLRRARADDREWMRSLNRECYREVMIEQFGSWEDSVQERFFAEKWDSDRFQIIRWNGVDIGALWVERREDHHFLSEIQIAPEFQGRGIGEVVLREILREAFSRNLEVRLRVLKQSRARRLYDRLGFVVTGETDAHWLMNCHPSPD